MRRSTPDGGEFKRCGSRATAGDASQSNPHVYGEGEAGEVGRNLKFALTSR